MQRLSGRVVHSRPRGRGFKPHQRHSVVYLSKNINPSLVLVQPWKTSPFITERLLMGRIESNQTNNNEVCNKGTALYEDNLKDILTSDSFVAKITCISMIVLQS